MIKILMNPQIFDDQNFGGISRYYTEICTQLRNKEGIDINCPLLYTNNTHYKESPLFENSYQEKNAILIKYSKIFRSYLPRKLKRKNVKNFISMLENQEFDLLLPTYYDSSFLAYTDKPFVLTVHDMIHELYPQYFINDTYTIPNKKLLMEKATRIIAVSENTKKDILNLYPHIESSKIEVIYLAYTIKTDFKSDLVLPEDYILFVGNRLGYKNFTFFLNAVEPLLKESPGLRLLCAGGDRFNPEEVRLIKELGLTGQVLQQNFEDKELHLYYKNAKCFIFPSEYEGFGIPILEAMACGCPVILTNHSSFPEVAGDAGIYFKLNDATDLYNKLAYLLENPDIRAEYKLRGLEQSKKFSWRKTAEECLKVYEKASKEEQQL